MFRRCVSLLVIAGFLAGQLAAVPHSHAGMTPDQQREHDLAPHFHWGWWGSAGHDQAHSHGTLRHPHVPPRHDAIPPGGVALCGDCHDADAIYVSPSAGTTTIPGRKVKTDAAPSLDNLAPVATCPHEFGAKARVLANWHPPDEVQDASDSYLTLRNLRI